MENILFFLLMVDAATSSGNDLHPNVRYLPPGIRIMAGEIFPFPRFSLDQNFLFVLTFALWVYIFLTRCIFPNGYQSLSIFFVLAVLRYVFLFHGGSVWDLRSVKLLFHWAIFCCAKKSIPVNLVSNNLVFG